MTPGEFAFFREADGVFVPSSLAKSPWRGDALNGAALSGLLGYLADRDRIDGLRPARFTADLLRKADFAPVRGEVVVIKRGDSSALMKVSLLQNGVTVSQAHVLWLRPNTNSDVSIWSGPVDFTPPDSFLSVVPGLPFFKSEGYGDWTRNWADHQNDGRKAMWHYIAPVVYGRDATPFTRAAVMADSASFVSNWGTEGVAFMNVDLSVGFSRMPSGGWIGLLATQHLECDGIAVGCALMLDAEGAFGHVTISGVSNQGGVMDFFATNLEIPVESDG